MESAPALPMIRGERIFLRASERSDIPTYAGWLNDARVTAFLGIDTPFSLPAEEAWYERMQAAQGRDNYHFAICLRENGQVIGTIGLHDVDSKHGAAEVGIAIGDPDLWGQGLGSDAMRAILDFGFGTVRLERIRLQVYAFNERARRSYEKVGFVLEGTQRSALYRNGRRHDVYLMSMLRSEWEAEQRPRSWELP